MPGHTRNSTKSHRDSSGFDKKLIAYAVAGGAVLAAPAQASGIIDYGGPTLTTSLPSPPFTNPIQILVNGVEYDFTGQGPATSGTLSNSWSSPGGGLLSGPLSLGQSVRSASFGLGPGTLNQGNVTCGSIFFKGHFIPNCSVTSITGIGFADTYLGLEFPVGGQNQYGWVELSANFYAGFLATAQTQVLDYAYQSTPGAGILVGQISDASPEPSTLALFALGAIGVAAVRRRRAKNA